jgi:hypothetical protein
MISASGFFTKLLPAFDTARPEGVKTETLPCTTIAVKVPLPNV